MIQMEEEIRSSSVPRRLVVPRKRNGEPLLHAQPGVLGKLSIDSIKEYQEYLR